MNQPEDSKHANDPKPTRREFASGVLAAAAVAVIGSPSLAADPDPAKPFGDEFPNLDTFAVGEWWAKKPAKKSQNPPPPLDVPRDEVVAFALDTVDHGVWKLTAQLYPLKPGEPREARLEVERDGKWVEVSKSPVLYPGWSAHFRVEKWDPAKSVTYRVRHGEKATFGGTVRRDPIDKDVIVVANMSCNSSRTTGGRPEIVKHLLARDPDLLFFAGDQTYRHTEHTAGWIEFGLQFRDVMRDRPTVSIPDDHDVGHPNLWGEGGKRCRRPDGADGYGVAKFDKAKRTVTFECWPRFSDAAAGDGAQFPGWPITVGWDDNDGRKPAAWLPVLEFDKGVNPVVKVTHEKTGEVVYAVRVSGPTFQPPVFAAGKYTVAVGRDRPDGAKLEGLEATADATSAGTRKVKL